MAIDNLKEKLDKVTSKDVSGFLEKARWSKENEAWLELSGEIALKVLRRLREKKITQSELAATMAVSPQFISKLAKGRENLTLETICKLEKALDIKLISVCEFHVVCTIKPNLLKAKNKNTPPVKHKYTSYETNAK